MASLPAIAIVVLNWNGLADTLVCLESLRRLRSDSRHTSVSASPFQFRTTIAIAGRLAISAREADRVCAAGRDRERCAIGREARARRRDEASDLRPVHRHLDRLHVRRHAAVALRRLERQGVAAGIQAQRLADAARTLDKRRLPALRAVAAP